MNDGYFRQILGVTSRATREEIRQAYRHLVMENHPDRFPAEKKPLQDLAIITLTEAYTALMSAVVTEPVAAVQTTDDPGSARNGASRTVVDEAAAANKAALASHRDPSYAYYKQGFINFSLAIHGIAEINRKIAAGRVPRFTRRYTAKEDIASSLAFLRAAHGYFSRVIDEHPHSVWSADANAKLRRIERFTKLYRRILANLSRRE